MILIAAVYFHQLAAGVLAAGSMVPVGFAASRQVSGSRLLAMVASVCLITTCAALGTLAGNYYPLTLVSALLGGLLCGLLALANEDLGWIAMQGMIAFLIANYFAGSWHQALDRATCVFIGGATQTLSILACWWCEGIPRFGPEQGTTKEADATKGERWADLLANTTPPPLSWHFSIRVAVTLSLAVELDHWLKLGNGYWLPMTTLIVLKPGFSKTYSGGIQRLAGTLAGVAFASLLTAIFHPGQTVLIALVAATSWMTFSSQKANAVIFAAALNSYVVLLIAITGAPEFAVVCHRSINTALGCALALTPHFVVFLANRFHKWSKIQPDQSN